MTILSQKFIDSINSRLSENKRVRRSLPIFGRLNIDRQLPFLCIYRHPVGADDVGTSRLVTTQASYMTSSGDRRISKNIKEVVRNVIETLSKEFGAFLILELWASEDNDEDTNVEFYERNSHFKIITLKNNPPLKTIESLRGRLEKLK